MAYYVDTGEGSFRETDNIQHAREIAQHAIEQAREFRDRMGWTPFWGRCVEIRKGKAGLCAVQNWCSRPEERNLRVVSKTKTHDILYLKD